jgi:very-short-patch-repair endonuclease
MVVSGTENARLRFSVTPRGLAGAMDEGAVAALANRQHGAMAWRQLREIGVDRRLAGRRCRAGVWEWATPTVLRLTGAPRSPEQRLVISILHAGPTAMASHESAAWLWALPGFGASDDVLLGRGSHPVIGAGHRPTLVLPHHRTTVRGIPCTSLPRTLFDLAGTGHYSGRMPSLVNAVVNRSPAMLPALHRTLDELACRGRPGITLMRDVLGERPIGTRVVESGLEARVLQIARNAGILDLEPQLDVGGHSWLGRVDFAIRRLRLLIEVDSVIHHSSPADIARDDERDEAMLAAGWAKVLRIKEEDVWPRPWLVAQQLRDTIRELERVLGTGTDH